MCMSQVIMCRLLKCSDGCQCGWCKKEHVFMFQSTWFFFLFFHVFGWHLLLAAQMYFFSSHFYWILKNIKWFICLHINACMLFFWSNFSFIMSLSTNEQAHQPYPKKITTTTIQINSDDEHNSMKFMTDLLLLKLLNLCEIFWPLLIVRRTIAENTCKLIRQLLLNFVVYLNSLASQIVDRKFI